MTRSIDDIFSGSGEDFKIHESIPVEATLPETLGIPEESGEIQPSLLKSETTAGEKANLLASIGKEIGKGVGIPIAVFGKLTGGAIGGAVGLTAGTAAALGAGMGWIASGVAGGDKFERKEAALKGGQMAGLVTALGVGAVLTPINLPFKFIENFGKGLIPKDSKLPETYTKFNDSYRTNVLPFCMTIGKKAVQEQQKLFDVDKTALAQVYDKANAKIAETKEKGEAEALGKLLNLATTGDQKALSEIGNVANKVDENVINTLKNTAKDNVNVRNVLLTLAGKDNVHALNALGELAKVNDQTGQEALAILSRSAYAFNPTAFKLLQNLYKEDDSRFSIYKDVESKLNKAVELGNPKALNLKEYLKS